MERVIEPALLYTAVKIFGAGVEGKAVRTESAGFRRA
jgi:hypothetical protein